MLIAVPCDETEAVEITDPETEAVETLVEMWIGLADGQRQYGSHVRGDDNRTQIRESILRHIAGSRLLVAETNEICGFVMFALERGDFEQKATRGIVENLYVRPQYRNDSIGSKLLVAAEKQLREQGAEAIILNVMAENKDARRFYRQHGYSPHRIEMEKRVEESE